VTGIVVFGLSTVTMAMLVGQARILYAMAKAGLGSTSFGETHPRFGTSWKGTLAVAVVVFTAVGLAGAKRWLAGPADGMSIGWFSYKGKQ